MSVRLLTRSHVTWASAGQSELSCANSMGVYSAISGVYAHCVFSDIGGGQRRSAGRSYRKVLKRHLVANNNVWVQPALSGAAPGLHLRRIYVGTDMEHLSGTEMEHLRPPGELLALVDSTEGTPRSLLTAPDAAASHDVGCTFSVALLHCSSASID